MVCDSCVFVVYIQIVNICYIPAVDAQQSRARFCRERQLRGVKKIAVNSDEYIQREENTIPVEEKFFYK